MPLLNYPRVPAVLKARKQATIMLTSPQPSPQGKGVASCMWETKRSKNSMSTSPFAGEVGRGEFNPDHSIITLAPQRALYLHRIKKLFLAPLIPVQSPNTIQTQTFRRLPKILTFPTK
jgi:hypothetical protein